MSTRLPIDGDLVAYWGFDEANPSDVAVDESGQANNLVVYNATAVVPARLGNGRQFDGTNTYAEPADSTPFWVSLNTILVWFVLDSVNQAGDMLRPLLTLEGAGGTVNDDTVHGLYIDNNGALIYRYTGGAREDCVYTTAAGLFRVNRYYSVALTRTTAAPLLGGGRLVYLYVNNQPVAWASRSVGGVPQVDPAGQSPLEGPTGNLTVLRVGASSKSVSKWHGVIDELSLHRTGRPKSPYLDAAYFRLTLATTFSRLTTMGTVKVLAAVDMGGGTRWWCYERDQSIYVIRENSLGLFSTEVQLTQGGNLANGAPMPGGVGKPRLAYDATTDTLVVAFVGAGRVYKVTGLSTDAPANLIMPYTQDTAGIIKANDGVDLLRWGPGDPTNFGVGPQDTTQGVTAPVVAFLHTPSFGVAVEGTSPYGYALYRVMGGEAVLVGVTPTAKQTAREEAAVFGSTNYWFFPIATRVEGAQYAAWALTASGQRIESAMSVPITDFRGKMVTNARVPAVWAPDTLTWSKDGDVTHDHFTGASGEGPAVDGTWPIASLFPLKQLLAESFPEGSGEGAAPLVPHGFVNATPIKFLLAEGINWGSGSGIMLVATHPVARRSVEL